MGSHCLQWLWRPRAPCRMHAEWWWTPSLLRYTYLDTHGRPVLVLRLKDTVDEHGGPFTVCTLFVCSLTITLLTGSLQHMKVGARIGLRCGKRACRCYHGRLQLATICFASLIPNRGGHPACSPTMLTACVCGLKVSPAPIPCR